MCGLTGVFGYGRDLELDEVELAARAELIAHRGPDDAGTVLFDTAAFSFRRLSIIDLEGGHQPMLDPETGTAIQFNGEIYNYRELRSRLRERGHRFTTESDTEVILRGYLEWGDDVVNHLNGIFSLALWDERQHRMLLARDHFGVKPLYYADDGSVLRFGSEMRTILADPGVERRLDPNALRLVLHYGYLPSPYTLIAGVSKLGPGHLLVCDESGSTVRRYADDVPEIQHGIDDDTAVDHYAALFEQAVTRQMVSDVEVGCLLSGGVDSGMVLAVASQQNSSPMRTFTVGFGNDFGHDESADAAETARHFGSNHHDLRIEVDDVEQLLADCLWHLEEPVLSQSTFAYHLMTREVRKHVKVVLTGQGADEPWAGYDRYLGERYGRRARWLFGSTVAMAFSQARPQAERFRRATESIGLADPVDRFTAIHQVFDPAMITQAAGRGLATASVEPRDVIAPLQRRVSHLDEFSQLLYVDTRLSLPDDLLLYGDKLSMSNSVEARVPILDRELMRFVESLPPQMKLRRRSAKHIHKLAAERLLPHEFVHRPKRGFATPIDTWFANELAPLLERTVLADDSVCSELLDPGVTRALVDAHRSGSRNHRRQLTTLVSLELVADQLLNPTAGPAVGATSPKGTHSS